VEKRGEVYERAENELNRLRGQYERPQMVEETPKQWKDRLVREGAGWEPQIVAVQFKTSVNVVKKVRLERGCFPHDGREMTKTSTKDEKVARVRELRAQGATIQEIVKLTGIPLTTAWRLAKSA
jgi:hypothetical protein